MKSYARCQIPGRPPCRVRQLEGARRTIVVHSHSARTWDPAVGAPAFLERRAPFHKDVSKPRSPGPRGSRGNTHAHADHTEVVGTTRHASCSSTFRHLRISSLFIHTPPGAQAVRETITKTQRPSSFPLLLVSTLYETIFVGFSG